MLLIRLLTLGLAALLPGWLAWWLLTLRRALLPLQGALLTLGCPLLTPLLTLGCAWRALRLALATRRGLLAALRLPLLGLTLLTRTGRAKQAKSHDEPRFLFAEIRVLGQFVVQRLQILVVEIDAR